MNSNSFVSFSAFHEFKTVNSFVSILTFEKPPPVSCETPPPQLVCTIFQNFQKTFQNFKIKFSNFQNFSQIFKFSNFQIFKFGPTKLCIRRTVDKT